MTCKATEVKFTSPLIPMNSATFDNNVAYWNTQIPTLHTWLKTLSVTYNAIISLEDAVIVFHALRLLFNFRNLQGDALLKKLQESLVSDLGPTLTFDVDERARAVNALHAHALLVAYRTVFFRYRQEAFEVALKVQGSLVDFKNWAWNYTEGLTMLADIDDHKSFVTLVTYMSHSHPQWDRFNIAAQGRHLEGGFPNYTVRQNAVIQTATRTAGANFQNSPQCVNLCLKDQLKGSPENIFSPRPRSIKQLRKEELKKKIPEREKPFRTIQNGDYESDPETNYKMVKRNPLKRTNAMIEEQWETELIKPNPKKLKTWEPLNLACEESLDEEVLPPTPPKAWNRWEAEELFTPVDLYDVKECLPNLSEVRQYEMAHTVFEAKTHIDAGWIRDRKGSRMVLRSTLGNGERLYMFVKTEGKTFDTELGDKLRQVIKEYKQTKIPLNKTQVIPLNSSDNEEMSSD